MIIVLSALNKRFFLFFLTRDSAEILSEITKLSNLKVMMTFCLPHSFASRQSRILNQTISDAGGETSQFAIFFQLLCQKGFQLHQWVYFYHTPHSLPARYLSIANPPIYHTWQQACRWELKLEKKSSQLKKKYLVHPFLLMLVQASYMVVLYCCSPDILSVTDLLCVAAAAMTLILAKSRILFYFSNILCYKGRCLTHIKLVWFLCYGVHAQLGELGLIGQKCEQMIMQGTSVSAYLKMHGFAGNTAKQKKQLIARMTEHWLLRYESLLKVSCLLIYMQVITSVVSYFSSSQTQVWQLMDFS